MHLLQKIRITIHMIYKELVPHDLYCVGVVG